jgi:DNA-binding NarL/FixJ family response regulator
MVGAEQAVGDLGSTDKVIRIAIVDDHELLAQALSMVVDQEPDLAMVGWTHSCAGAEALVARTCPDVLLLDVSLPDGDGLALMPRLRAACPATQVLVLTSMADENTLLRALEAGVSGFFGKHRPVAEVLAAVRQAADGELVMPTALLLGLLARQRAQPARTPAAPPPGREPLTAREREVLACAAEGLSTAAIAQRLNISVLTVRTHLRNVLAKLDAHSRLEAVALALREGLIEPPR